MSLHVPMRTCVGCRAVGARTDLRRYVVVDGTVTPDDNATMPGRGAWLHDDPDCLKLALRRGGFQRSFRRAVRSAIS